MTACEKCGGEITEITGRLEFEDPYVGLIVLEEASFLRCNNSHVQYPVETLRRIEKARETRLYQAISNYPERDFVTSAEAADTLGVTRQAVNKNRRIRRGFIYKVDKSDSCTLFLRQSLDLYKKTGDGRFPLFPKEQVVDSKYVGETVALLSQLSYQEEDTTSVIELRTHSRQVESIGANLYATN
jgi:hypothetical protein